MRCIICDGPTSYYFSKQFGQYGLGNVDYHRCAHCGFVASKTHFDMSDDEWTSLNAAFHSDSNAREDNPYNRNQRYFNQALMLHLMVRAGMLPTRTWLDWGSGVGSVSNQLDRHFSLELLNFDRYVTPPLRAVCEDALVRRSYRLVVNTAVFEHVRSRATLDEIESYVAPDGHLAVHTLVRGEIPADPDWMYLLPVHCAFHTNRSMDLLMQQWGYTCSVYNEHSKMWVMFRSAPDQVQLRTHALNDLLGWEYLHFKHGFMDYWP
jgi:hypothetical protein